MYVRRPFLFLAALLRIIARRENAQAMAIGISATTIGGYDATSSVPISQRTFRNVCVKSARY